MLNGRGYAISCPLSYSSIATNACSAGNGGCVHLCLPVPNGRRSCVCASGKTAECLPSIRGGRQAVVAEVLTPVTLRCEVESNGFNTTVEFSKNGTIVQSEFYPSTPQHWLVTARYTLSPVRISDGGAYLCTARNSYGYVSLSRILTVVFKDYCKPFPCQNNGTCIVHVNDYSCDCVAGYTGKDCGTEVITSECSSNPCQNGGNCIEHVNGYSCDCVAGYTGKDCGTEVIVSECSPTPCQNGGNCIDHVNGYSCDCVAGYTGKDCGTEVIVSECSPTPCQNGGNCIDHVNGYSCDCVAGYTGKDCGTEVIVSECSPTPCQNGGNCIDHVNG